MSGWTGHIKKQTSGSIANKSKSLISFLSCSHHSKAEFSEEIWERWGFAEIKGRFLNRVREEQGRKQKDDFHRVCLQANLPWAARGPGGGRKQTLPEGEDGDRECKEKMTTFQWGNRRGAKDGQGEHGQTSVRRKMQNFRELSAQQGQRKTLLH